MMIKKNKGFTLVELMMVMVVMALVATLATGAAMKSIKQGKERKIDATCVALRMALTNYRANEQCWPVPLEPLGDSTTVTFHENNAKDETFSRHVVAAQRACCWSDDSLRHRCFGRCSTRFACAEDCDACTSGADFDRCAMAKR
jgi:type IV pilus assembly protein PilE